MTADATRPRVTAVGGTRDVPVPDPIAADYLLLALRLDQHVPGLVDGYFGPADLKARVDLENLRPPGRLADDAAELRARVARDVEDPDRRGWLDAQLVALETQAAAIAGEALPYVEHLRRCFSVEPVRRDEARFDDAARTIEQLLAGAPGSGPGGGATLSADGDLTERLDAWDQRFTIPPERLPAIVDWLVDRFRARAATLFGLPPGEALTVRMVNNQPWTGYNWYDGGLRSRVDLNLDLPIRTEGILQTIAHETFPGHHLEHAWKEADLVEHLGRLEASVLCINTPECLISEGLADVGVGFAVPADEAVDVRIELFERAALVFARDRAAAREAAAAQVALSEPRRILSEARVNAALLRHAHGLPRDEVLGWLRRHGRLTEAAATKRLEFIEHPLWRTYVFVYHEGEALLRRWLDAVTEDGRAERFARLLHEQLTPTAIAAETQGSG